MEALVLMGIIGVGYLANEQNENKNPVDVAVSKEVNYPSDNNVYDSTHYNEVENEIKLKIEESYEKSKDPSSNVVNNQKIDEYNLKDNLGNYTYSNAAGGYIENEEFMSNNQGVKMEPFFSSAPTTINLDDSRRLDMHQGDSGFYKEKREIGSFFEPQKGLTNINGNEFGEYIGDKNRYLSGNTRQNELPFEQERVSHIDVKSNLNGDINRAIAEKTNVDALRAKSNPKLTYEGKVLKGRSVAEERGKLGEVFQHNPDKFYKNNPDKWFVTTGAYLEKSERPEQLVKDTFRSKFNSQQVGSAAPASTEAHENRPSFRKPLKLQLGTDTVRNPGANVFGSGTDIQQEGYRNIPNERDVTTLRRYDGNLTTGVDSSTMGIQDEIKRTVRESTQYTKNNGNVNNTVINHTTGLMDGLKVTKKQTTVNSQNNGYIKGGLDNPTLGYEKPEPTTKDSTIFSYTGGGGASVLGDMNKENYNNAETNPTKEIISQGRTPTINNTKISNGMDTVNVDIKKIEGDYMNYRENGLEKVYQEIPSDNTCEVTTMKDRLDDYSISDRIDPNLLNPFRDNPYTKPLDSFAY
tara:strand:+ start:13350 stop:15083 length:1734 start_codon:yes stop_codon:yes gene_type:complete